MLVFAAGIQHFLHLRCRALWSPTYARGVTKTSVVDYKNYTNTMPASTGATDDAYLQVRMEAEMCERGRKCQPERPTRREPLSTFAA